MQAEKSGAMAKSVFHLSDGAAVTSESPEERNQREAEAFNVQDFVNEVQDALRNNKIYLPTLPTVALEALLVINDINSSAADLEKVSLLDVHRAVGGVRVFAIGNEDPDPQCAVERVVNAAVADVLRDAEALLMARLGAVSLAELAKGFGAIRLQAP